VNEIGTFFLNSFSKLISSYKWVPFVALPKLIGGGPNDPKIGSSFDLFLFLFLFLE
jgi:hypothetical protein